MNEPFLSDLAQNGILGLLLTLAILGLIFFYREIKNERKERLDDLKEIWEKDLQYRQEIKNLINSIFELLRGKQQ